MDESDIAKLVGYLPEEDRKVNKEIALDNLFKNNNYFRHSLFEFAQLLKQGEFDPEIRPALDDERQKVWSQQDSWKVSASSIFLTLFLSFDFQHSFW